MSKKPEQKEWAILAIMTGIGSERRYPHMRDVLAAIKEAKGLSFEKIAKNIREKHPERKAHPQDIRNKLLFLRHQTDIVLLGEGLGLPEKDIKTLLKEHIKRSKRQENENAELHFGTKEDFTKLIREALDFYGKKLKDLKQFLGPSEGITQYGPELLYGDRDLIFDAFKRLIDDPNYTADQLITDSKQPLPGKFVHPLADDKTTPPKASR